MASDALSKLPPDARWLVSTCLDARSVSKRACSLWGAAGLTRLGQARAAAPGARHRLPSRAPAATMLCSCCVKSYHSWLDAAACSPPHTATPLTPQLLSLGACSRQWRRLAADQQLWERLARHDFPQAAFAPSYPSWKAAYQGALESLRPRAEFLLLSYGKAGPAFPPKRAAAPREHEHT